MLHSWGPARMTLHFRGWKFIPFRQTTLLLQLRARAIVCSCACRLGQQVKLIYGNIRVIVHQVGNRSHPIILAVNNTKTVLSIVWYTYSETGLVGCAFVSEAGMLGRHSESCCVNDTALWRWCLEVLIFFGWFYLSFHWFTMKILCVDNKHWGWERRHSHFNLMVK